MVRCPDILLPQVLVSPVIGKSSVTPRFIIVNFRTQAEGIDEAPLPQVINPCYLGLTPELVELCMASPYGIRECKYSNSLFSSFFPSKETVKHLVDLYYRHSTWMFVGFSIYLVCG
jgi:hypothetical protein